MSRTNNQSWTYVGIYVVLHGAKAKKNDRVVIDRCAQIVDWTIQKGYDTEYGGMVNLLDYNGDAPEQYIQQRKFGESWNSKVWWIHSETLYPLLLTAIETRQMRYFDVFKNIHEWCKKYFHDSEYGEWYSYLHQDGKPRRVPGLNRHFIYPEPLCRLFYSWKRLYIHSKFCN